MRPTLLSVSYGPLACRVTFAASLWHWGANTDCGALSSRAAWCTCAANLMVQGGSKLLRHGWLVRQTARLGALAGCCCHRCPVGLWLGCIPASSRPTVLEPLHRFGAHSSDPTLHAAMPPVLAVSGASAQVHGTGCRSQAQHSTAKRLVHCHCLPSPEAPLQPHVGPCCRRCTSPQANVIGRRLQQEAPVTGNTRAM